MYLIANVSQRTSSIHIWFRIQKNVELMEVIRTIKYLLMRLKAL